MTDEVTTEVTAEVKAELKKFVIPVYPSRKTAPYPVLKKKYLKTRDFYDLPESVEFDSTLYRDAHEPERLVFYKRDARMVIYPSDLVAMYGISARTARRWLQEVREDKGIKKGPVTITEFCDFAGRDYETVHLFIMES